jgi:hypothetical protein
MNSQRMNNEESKRPGLLKRFFGRLKRFFDTLFRHPLFNSLVTLLIIVAGGVGAIYSDEIKNAFPFYWGHGPWSHHASLFWLIAIVASILFFFRERAVTRAQEESQKLLERLIRTSPPENFLSVFSNLVGPAAKVVEAATLASRDPKNEEADLKLSIRQILQMIATLAQKFDGDDPRCRYGANVMVFLPTTEMSVDEKERFRKELIFCDPTVGIAELRGILRIEIELSTTAGDKEVKADAALKNVFALPIPKEPMNLSLYKVLPGAPLAFVKKQADLYTDTHTLADWCEKFGDFTQEVTRAVDTHFHESPIRSFVSIPLFPASQNGIDDLNTEPFAILNVHSDKTDLLREQGEPLRHYVAILRPFQVFLVQLLFRLKALKK